MNAATIARWLLERLPHDQLTIDGQPYMRRYYLAGYKPLADCSTCHGTGIVDVDAATPAGIWCPDCESTGYAPRSWWWRWPFGAIRLHKILSSDDQRAFHDHPWGFVSIGLAGSYTEERPRTVVRATDGTVRYASRCGAPANRIRTFVAPWVLIRRATDLHSLTLRDGAVWTLVLMGRKSRSWGFADPSGWMHWRDFDRHHPGRDAVVVTFEADASQFTDAIGRAQQAARSWLSYDDAVELEGGGA